MIETTLEKLNSEDIKSYPLVITAYIKGNVVTYKDGEVTGDSKATVKTARRLLMQHNEDGFDDDVSYRFVLQRGKKPQAILVGVYGPDGTEDVGNFITHHNMHYFITPFVFQATNDKEKLAGYLDDAVNGIVIRNHEGKRYLIRKG